MNIIISLTFTQLGLFARQIKCKAKLYYKISYNSLHEKYDKEKNSQSGSLYFLALVSFPSFPISTSFLSLFFPFPFFSFSHIHPRSIVCILDAHTLYPKRRYTDMRARICVCVYVRIYDYVYIRNWKYPNDFTDG